MFTKQPEDLDRETRYTNFQYREHITKLPPSSDHTTQSKLNSNSNFFLQNIDRDEPLKVGIIGSGAAGLFVGMLFDYFRTNFGLKVDYEILEANGEDRLGGRLFSYYFKDVENPGPHDYFDAGAMRFPENQVMTRLFQLFEELGMEKVKEPTTNRKKGDIIPYFYNGDNTPLLYNDVQTTRQLKNPNDLNPVHATIPKAEDFSITNLPPGVGDKDPEDLLQAELKPFVDALAEDPGKGWKYLMEKGDKYSVRQYLTLPGKYDYDTVNWMETFNAGNRYYDQALTQAVLEAINFSNPNPWWTVEGGAQQLARNMRDSIEKDGKSKVSFEKRVTAMKYDSDDLLNRKIEVSIKGEKTPRKYDAVFNSAMLGSMQLMDLTGLNLSYRTKQCIRSLGYAPCCKVGIRFKKLWWISDPKLQIYRGGAGKTDLLLGTCVYPSYNIHDDPEKPGVLLVSYSLSEQSQRIASMVNRESPKGEEELKEKLFHDLAKLHSPTKDEEEYQRLYKIIEENYDTHFAIDWCAQSTFSGAVAYFGPGQFKHLFPGIVQNDGKHIIIGEGSAAHHGWVVGAVESAVRGVYQFLYAHSHINQPEIKKIVDSYNEDKIPGPFGPLPPEFDRIEGVMPNMEGSECGSENSSRKNSANNSEKSSRKNSAEDEIEVMNKTFKPYGFRFKGIKQKFLTLNESLINLAQRVYIK